MALPGTPHTLETVTGKFVDLINPDPADICIEDIGWALSRLARFNGHTIQPLPYCVGQHSIEVAGHVANNVDLWLSSRVPAPYPGRHRLILLGLLHDASEAYTGDVSGPLKKIAEFRPIIKKLEHTIQEAIYEALGIKGPTEDEEWLIKHGDLFAQRIEAYNFMPSRGINWSGMPEVSIIELQKFEMPKPSVEVYKEFMDMYHKLKAQIS
jgi:hypothetical protein